MIQCACLFLSFLPRLRGGGFAVEGGGCMVAAVTSGEKNEKCTFTHCRKVENTQCVLVSRLCPLPGRHFSATTSSRAPKKPSCDVK
ncbi:unnamed protein product, partial [Ectocarpus sp. 6 AP-2014]